MRVAVRDHENPALDAAVAAANLLGTTVLVYHGVSERYPFASDRHHTFILEGARDVAAGLRERKIAYALHVERPGARGAHLAELAQRAALVITEDAPVPPLDAWERRLSGRLSSRGVPFVAVDASCVVPMPLVPRAYDRAYAFRAATESLVAERLSRSWSDIAPLFEPRRPELPFVPVDAESLDDRAIARLVSECDIDHSVGPVRALPGGSRAGYARFCAFVRTGLARYAERRNDAAIDGTSRLSPWLHYGHVSPLRIAREVAALPPTASTEKFLDELLVWRELAWHFAAHTKDLDSLDALPRWARESLAKHASDARDVMSEERLERGGTGDRLWDLAQQTLHVTGELHNNLRMTWGKAIPAWTDGPEAARRTLVSLNHRYALDGRDPASYGGLYWCLGLFDRPFTPETPVLGTIRSRPTADHARRLDVEAYRARCLPRPHHVGRVAVIGAGIAGLSCARTLHDHGVDVTVFDKGRTPGGRLASGTSLAHGVDLGAQYFTVRDERFGRFVRSWTDDGIVARWTGTIGAIEADGAVPRETAPLDRFVGIRGMGSIATHLARDLVIRTSHRVDVIDSHHGQHLLRGMVGHDGRTLGPRDSADAERPCAFGAFDVVIVCLPAPQARAVLEGVSPTLAMASGRVELDPCVALAFAPEVGQLDSVPFDGLFVGRDDDGERVVTWLARDSSKPQHAEREVWVVHASPSWSRRHLRAPQPDLERELLAAVARALGRDGITAEPLALRRWALARAPRPYEGPALFDDEARIGVGGDWACGGRVEGAFLSGVALAGRVLGLPATAHAGGGR